MPVVKTHVIAQGVTYSHHPHHRNRTPDKSQWTIPESDERGVFIDAMNQNWLKQSSGWGLYSPNDRVEYVGLAQDHKRRVFVAKFVTAQNRNSWHGYPADHERNAADIPDEDILLLWMNSEILPATKIGKLTRMQSCCL
jgi:hypothetical protein